MAASNGVPGRSVYPKGPSFTLETFSSKDFMVKDFIESLSDSALPINRRSAPSTQAFDPKPLIRTFESALRSLGDLSDDLTIHETELLTAVRRAEAQHKQTLESLGKKLDQTIGSFQTLDTDLNSVHGSNGAEIGGNAALKIGEKLEELDRQARRAQDAKFLIQCWLDVSERGELTALEELRRRGDGDGKVRCAVIARQLMKISQRLDQENWQQTNGGQATNGSSGKYGRPGYFNTRELIEKFSETLEKDLLKQFDQFYRMQHWAGMRECANVLYDFNGGANVIALFVNQHQFFIDRTQLVTEEIAFDSETWERLADPDAEPPGVEPSLQSLIEDVGHIIEAESTIIKRAFPYYELVLGKFLQRVFQQPIQQRLEMVLDKANTVSSLAFLRSLQAARSSLSTLVETLKAHGLTEHPEPISLQTALVLDQQLDELFVPYLMGFSYIEREKRSLEELYSSLLFKFTTFHSRRKRQPTTFMATLAKSGSEMLASAKDAYLDRLDSSDLTPAQRAMLLRVAGLKEDGGKNKDDIELTEQDGALSIASAKRMLRWLAEGVGRGLELSGGTETPKDVAALLNLLLSNMGEAYVEVALDAANDIALSQESSKAEPDLSYLPHLRSATSITHLMVTCINTVLVPLASSNLSVRLNMERTRDTAIGRMEEKTNSTMQRTVDASISWIQRLLAQQKKTDFRPKDGAPNDDWLERIQTSTCDAISEFLAKILDLSSQGLSGSNLEGFLNELATGVRSLLLEHFKKFQVSALGALMIQKDVRRYVTTLQEWPISASLKSSLDVLVEIGALFVVKPEALRDRLRTGALGNVGREELRPYVLRREDVGSVGMQTALNSL